MHPKRSRILERSLLAAQADSAANKERERRVSEYVRRTLELEPLFTELAVEKTGAPALDYAALAFALHRKYSPKRRGKKRAYYHAMRFLLLLDVEAEKRRSGVQDGAEAVRALIGRKETRWYGKTEGSLRDDLSSLSENSKKGQGLYNSRLRSVDAGEWRPGLIDVFRLGELEERAVRLSARRRR
jgi:hypothetical protein